ncbi:MAG: FAD:protein FMN transferase [Patescibacteria group bacterium]|nr:FAD:protein FMN transferase [Patescibacteria group bacterium]
MREGRSIMGMPITVEIVGGDNAAHAIEKVFAYFTAVDERFSTYKDTSEISLINRGETLLQNYSNEMKEVFALAEKTKKESSGYFDITKPDGSLDPSGIVKGWAIHNAANLLYELGHTNFYVEAGGDIATSGRTSEDKEWSVGIRHPFEQDKIVKVIYPKGAGVATSGSYLRGAHIYNPHAPEEKLSDIVSITVVGPDVLEADRFATAAFAMGRDGIKFIEQLKGFEAYMIDKEGIATMTSGFEKYLSA